jgi:hypothetical protein
MMVNDFLIPHEVLQRETFHRITIQDLVIPD